MYKKRLSVSVVFLALILTSSALAAVGGSNPTPQVRSAAPVSQAVGGSNPTPQVATWWSVLLSALGF